MVRVLSITFIVLATLLLFILGATTAWLNEGMRVSLKPVQGGGSVQAGDLLIDRFQQGRAIVTSAHLALQADAYPLLGYRLTGPIAGVSRQLLFWRSEDAPDKISTRSLPVTPVGMIDLGSEAEWRGEISEIGFILYGDSGQAYRLQMPVLYSGGWEGRLLWYLGGWLGFEPWSQHSINYLFGGNSNQQFPLPLLILLSVLLWWIVAMLFHRRLEGGRWQLLLAATLAGWLLLDARWLYNQLRQFQLTDASFAELSELERLRQGEDSDIFQYASRLKRTVLPQYPVPIFILSQASANDYLRLKLQYHLAPHNVFNYGRFPPRSNQKTDGYIIVLEQIEGLVFDQAEGVLRWGRNGRVKVSLVDRDEWATLYKITSQ